METTRWVSNGPWHPRSGCSRNVPRSRSTPDGIRTMGARFCGGANPGMSSVSAASTAYRTLLRGVAACAHAERHRPRTRTATFRVAARYLAARRCPRQRVHAATAPGVRAVRSPPPRAGVLASDGTLDIPFHRGRERNPAGSRPTPSGSSPERLGALVGDLAARGAAEGDAEPRSRVLCLPPSALLLG